MRTLKLVSSGTAQFATKTRALVSLNGACIPLTVVPPGWVFTKTATGERFVSLASLSLGLGAFSGRQVLLEAETAGAINAPVGTAMTMTTPLTGSPTLSITVCAIASSALNRTGRNAESASDNAIATSMDLDLRNNKLQLIDDTDAIAQKLRIGLRIFRGEFFADRDVGIPYYEKILVKNPRLGEVQAIFKKAILSCEGVISVENMTTRYFAAERRLDISFYAKMQSGRLVPVRDSFIIGLVA